MQIRSAHHEPGHVVLAAVQGLKLRREGIMVASSGNGLGCYDKELYGSDDIRLRVVTALWGGYFAERQSCNENGYSIDRYDHWFRSNPDGAEASKLATPDEIWPRAPVAERIVDENWSLIKELAAELQSRTWEPIKQLPSKSQWWKDGDTMAKYVVGEEVIEILKAGGIPATLV
jgi:hypothetical protein